jgi:hypothetical protein
LLHVLIAGYSIPLIAVVPADLLVLAVLPAYGVLVVLVRRKRPPAEQMIGAKQAVAALAEKILSVSSLPVRFDTAGRFPGGSGKPPSPVLKAAYP